MSAKILICGDVNGKLHALYKKIEKLQKKSQFEILFCIGNFFGGRKLDDYVSGKLIAPIPTYVVGPISSEYAHYVSDAKRGCEICPQILYLGNYGVYSHISSLKIAYISTAFPDSDNQSDNASKFTAQDLHMFLHEQVKINHADFIGVDILLSSCWPCWVNRCTKEGKPSADGCRHIATAAFMCKPRYHFAAQGSCYYERHPYRNHRVLQEKDKHCTRFVGLACVKNKEKLQWLYGLNITPIVHLQRQDLVKQPDDVTENPYREMMEKSSINADNICTTSATADEDLCSEQYFYDLPNSLKLKAVAKRKNLEQRTNAAEKRVRPTVSSPCWFCLGNPQVEKHLVVSVGAQIYLAMPRGPLTPEHVLILPIGHHQSAYSLPDAVYQEIEDMKQNLKNYYHSKGLAMVIFERNLESHHLQLQCIGVDMGVASVCSRIFRNLGLKQTPKIVLEELPSSMDLRNIQILKPGIPYFYVEPPVGRPLFTKINFCDIKLFDLQFGRAVLAAPELLNCPEKINWRASVLSKEEEAQFTVQFRNDFAPFDKIY